MSRVFSETKIPGPTIRSGDIPFFPQDPLRVASVLGGPPSCSGRSSDSRIILLTAPSHSDRRNSGIKRLSSPMTAAGPSPNLTGFPFELHRAPESPHLSNSNRKAVSTANRLQLDRLRYTEWARLRLMPFSAWRPIIQSGRIGAHESHPGEGAGA